MEYLPHIFYINLDKRPDRLTEIQGELSRMGLSGERIPALYTPAHGSIGCTFSHIYGLKLARERGLSHVLILEDDFQFVVDKTIFENNLRDFFSRGIEYDVLFLSYNLREGEHIDNLIGRGRNVQTASGFVVHQRFYDTLISQLEDGFRNLVTTLDHGKYTIDQYWKPLQKTHSWYYFKNRIGIQRESFSNIEGKVVKYSV
jgi:hypothetical protein